jgi:hypothetical protein
LPEDARVELAHVESAKATGKVTAALANLLLAGRDAFALGLARIRLTRLHPIVARRDQLELVVEVCE